MKKKLLGIVFCGMLILSCLGCSVSYQEATNTNKKEDYGNGYFTVVTEWNENSRRTYRIVYANDTNVKYLIVVNGHQYGITPLYNADGTLQIYGEE